MKNTPTLLLRLQSLSGFPLVCCLFLLLTYLRAAPVAEGAAAGYELKLERTSFAPSENITVQFKTPAGIPNNSWVGIIPAEVEHGSRSTNDQHDIQYRYLQGKTEGELVFNPVVAGKWSLRLNVEAGEPAYVDFEVREDFVPPGQLAPSLSLERKEYAPSEPIVVRFTAPEAYPNNSWVGIIPADVEHGSRELNGQHDIQYRYLSGNTEGELTFNPIAPGKWSLRLNAFSIETASVDFEVAETVVPPGQSPASLTLDRTRYAPSEKITVRFTAPEVYPNNSWVGIIPAEVEHGSRELNGQHDIQYLYLQGKTEGELTFNPVAPGKWSLRLNAFSIETASVDFEVAETVVPPGQLQPSLSLDRHVYAPSEKITVRFTAPEAYPNNTWVGIIPAEVEHGSRSINDQHDVQYQYLSGKTEGELTFNAVKVGQWSFRLNAFTSETASVDFEVRQDAVPKGKNLPVLATPRKRFATGEKIPVHFTAPDIYPNNSWVGIIPADVEHGSRSINDQHDVQYLYLSGKTEGVLHFNPLPAGKWTARLNAFDIETTSTEFEVVDGMQADASKDAGFELKVKPSPGLAEQEFIKAHPEVLEKDTVKVAQDEASEATSSQDKASSEAAEAGDGIEDLEGKVLVSREQDGQTLEDYAERMSDNGGKLKGDTTEVASDKSSEGSPEKVSEDDSEGLADDEADEEEADKAKADIPQWMKDLPPLPTPKAMRVVNQLDFRGVTGAEYAGIVSQAKETVAELIGPMDAKQSQAFDASWQPMYAYPAPECIEYLESIIPIAERVLYLRSALVQTSRITSQLWEEAGYAEYYKPEAAAQLMAQVRSYTASIQSMQLALQDLMADLDGLGEPPNPGALQQQAQQRHRRAMRTLESLLGGVPDLEGYYEELSSLVCTDEDADGNPYYEAELNEQDFHTLAITPLSNSASGLVLFSEYTYSEAANDNDSFLSDLDLDISPWGTWYAEATETGWVHYNFTEEDGTIEAKFYRPESDQMVVDIYFFDETGVDVERHIYHRAPLDKGTVLFEDGETRETVMKMVEEHQDDLREAEKEFHIAKAAYQQFMAENEVPALANPEDLYWVLKDVTVNPDPQKSGPDESMESSHISYTYPEIKNFDCGNNSFSASWTEVEVSWDYLSNPIPEAGPGEVYIPSPDEEEIGGGEIVRKEKRTAMDASSYWTMAPPVLPDGTFWSMDPRVQGKDSSLGINCYAADNPFAVVSEVNADALLVGNKAGLLLLPYPIKADERANSADEDACEPVVKGSKEGESYEMAISLRSRRLRQFRTLVKVTTICPAGRADVDFLYEQKLMSEDEARALAGHMEGSLPSVELSEAALKHRDDASFNEANEEYLAEQKALNEERIALHQANIAWSKQNAERLKGQVAELEGAFKSGKATEAEVEQMRQLQFRLACEQSNVISEQDRIQEVKTGKPTHSRTPFDEMCRAQMVQKCRESVRELETGIRSRRKAEYLMKKMSPEQRKVAQRILDKMAADGKGLYAADYEKLNAAMQDIFQGDQEFQIAQAEEQAAYENAWVEGAENIKTGADVGLMVCSMGGGPMWVNVAYQTGSGWAEKGIVEGVKRGIATYSDTADILISGYDGWQAGGFWGAVEGASWSILMNKGPEVAMGRLNMSRGFDGGYRPINVDGPKAPKDIELPTKTVKPSSKGADAIAAGQFKQEMEYGEALAKDYFSDYTKWKTAQIKGDMDPKEFKKLEMQVRQKAAAVAHSMTAKSYLKYEAPGRMGSAFTEVHTEILDDATRAFHHEMKALGFNEQEIRQFRNISSMDAGMDSDMGLIEQPFMYRVKNADGTVSIKENLWLTRNGKPITVSEYQRIGGKVLADNYKHVSGGYNADQSFVGLTTKMHAESYMDKNWLKVPKAGAHDDLGKVLKAQDALFGKMDPDMLPHDLQITPKKAELMIKEHPELRPLGSMMESCRGTAKDLDTKFIPLVDAKIRKLEDLPKAKRTPDVQAKLKELAETKQYLQQCRDCMSDIGKGRTHPGRWMDDFKMITGGEDVLSVIRRLTKMTEMASKM